MNLYRYELTGPGIEDAHAGFLTAIEDTSLDIDTAMFIYAIFEDKLDAPPINMGNTISWFTEKGHRKFRKHMREAKKILAESGYKLHELLGQLHSLDSAAFHDQCQVIFYRNHWNEMLQNGSFKLLESGYDSTLEETSV